MPIYEYQCSNGHYLVVAASINDKPDVPVKCEECGEDLVRLFGSVGVQFKGKGWGKDA